MLEKSLIRRRDSARTGLFVLVALGLGALLAVAIVKRPAEDGRPKSIATVTSAGVTFSLVGLVSEGCVTTVRACLGPGASVTRFAATIAAVGSGAAVDERSVIASIRASGHEVQGSEAVSPRLKPFAVGELRELDALTGEWLDVRCKPSPCLDCAMALEGRIKELAGVREVVTIHNRDHLAVRRDATLCPTSKLADHIRSITHESVAIAPTKLVAVSIANMTCNKCIGSIRGVLLRTDAVLSPTVDLGSARVIVATGTPGKKIADAIETAPGPACKSIPEHIFKANVTDEKDDGVAR